METSEPFDVDIGHLAEKAGHASEVGTALTKAGAVGGVGSGAAIFMVENAQLIGAIAALVSILGVVIGVIINIYFRHRMLELEVEKVKLSHEEIRGICDEVRPDNGVA